MDDIEKTLADRSARYGSFDSHARITQSIKRVMVDTPQWPNLSDPQRESLEMVAHKIGRILNGDPNYLDSWVDIEGYVHLVVEVLITAQETPAPDPKPPVLKICAAWEVCTADSTWPKPCDNKIPHIEDCGCRVTCDGSGVLVICRDITPEDLRLLTTAKDQICPSWKQCRNDGCDHKIPHAVHPHCENPCHLGDLMEPGVICRKMGPAEIALFRDEPKGDA